MGSEIAPNTSFNFSNTTKARRWLHETWWPHIDSHIDVVNDFRYLGAHLSAGSGRTSRTLKQRWAQAIIQLRRLKHCPSDAISKTRAITAKIYAAAFYGVEASGINDREVAQMSVAVIDVYRSRNNKHDADSFYATNGSEAKDIDPNSQILSRRVMQIRRNYCKQGSKVHQSQAIMRRYVRESKQQPPVWYHDLEKMGNKPPEIFPTPQQHPSKNSTEENWAMGLEEQGPIGLLILAALRAGVKIDTVFKLWQQKEEPVDIFHTPYQSLQPQIIQMLARARTSAAWKACDKPRLNGLREIDPIATRINNKIDEEDKGLIKTINMGGGMTNGDIAEWNEDVDGTCSYCMAEDTNITHLIWECPFFDCVRQEQDAELAAIPIKNMLPCILRGVAPAMEVDGNKTFWGQDMNELEENQMKLLGKNDKLE
jgi:hypothetical protein